MSKVASAILIFNALKPQIEEVIETFMDVISLTQENSVSLKRGVTYGSNGVNL